MHILQDEIARFQKWAPPPGQRHGEWETSYPHWDRLWTAAIFTIDQFAHTAIPPHTADGLLYVIARDNECERIREHLVEAHNCCRFFRLLR